MMIDYSLQDVNFAVPTIYNGQQNFYKKYSSIWYLKRNLDWLIEESRRPIQNSYACKLWYTERKN